MIRPVLRTTTAFSAHSSTSGGWNMSLSQARPDGRVDIVAQHRAWQRSTHR
jgi:hypothetical protein